MTLSVGEQPLVLGDNDKSSPWYSTSIRIEVLRNAREILEEYARVPPETVETHILTLRDKIWDVFPYPCVGRFSFLDFYLHRMPLYSSLVDRLKSPDAKHLDVACCIGQDIRKLVYDGVPSQNIVGLEIEKGFVDAGYELFRDKQSLQSEFIVADILDDEDGTLEDMVHQFDSAHLGMCLHLWNRDDQTKALLRVIRLLKAAPGVAILGHTIGHTDGIEVSLGMNGKPSLRHNVQTWGALWADLSEATGSCWKVEAEMYDDDSMRDRLGVAKPSWWDSQWRLLAFEVTRKS
ncbi:methyltransferase domain-containing protein [Colletotrichum scovillei]|uniref:Methyltransferase domain-containing protein n=1 Tax=Colletotrichum scovillei TaxID=1209932 RepID=A0A9P7QV24_9PEZI|nr:methyltransferase domain-containing protein [Colletotrichum scovillei]KAF4775227.1 methyltransferase domain-containing protein [Colletotrichum scovillei]KAG7042652.1 methyltransferase domain-containing protein [Colletotrichum scovillei]KAG7043244.1 methyltransferase domain-containing protein [Colletotrichum scovillei]KAG7062691.1 methyltransferase domain-containing protein [Colletotrichum scovillei]